MLIINPDHIQRNERILHPEIMKVSLWEDKEHPTIFSHECTIHQSQCSCLWRICYLYRKTFFLITHLRDSYPSMNEMKNDIIEDNQDYEANRDQHSVRYFFKIPFVFHG